MSTNPYAPPQATVADIPVQGIVKAGRGMRLVAATIDGLILGLFVYVPAIANGSFGTLIKAAAASPQALDAGAMISIMQSSFAAMGIGFLIWAVITFVLVKRNGQTIAKKLFGMKVVRTDGTPAGVGRIFWLRNFVNALPSLIPILGWFYVLIDSCWIFGEERRCLHDRIADTIVVNA